MAKNSKGLLVGTEMLNKENAFLKLQLREAKESIDAIKTGNIDALVISHEKALKVYTEETADKPYRLLIEKMHEGAVTLNEDGTILYCNSYFANMVNLPLQNVNQEKLKRRTKQLEEKNTELESTNKELAYQIEEKEKRGAELTIAKTDVKELEGLNTHKESVLATLSHDLRSPLAGIIGLAELLKENFETFENNTLKEMLDLLYKSSTDELIMLDYLVEWARIKYASEAFSPAKIELKQYVKKVFITLNENAVANKVHLYNEIEENISVFADRKMLLSILQNIVSNSIKYTRAGGKITVTAERKEDKIIIEINDNGIGMSKEIKEKLFTPQMISLSNARKENKGAGIGLLLVKSFLEKNNGEIWVESTKGEGSSFYFTLPLKKPLDKNNSQTKMSSWKALNNEPALD